MWQGGGGNHAVHVRGAGLRDQSIERWADGEPGGIAGQVKVASFTLAGQRYMASDSAGPHNFTFTPSFSIFVDCSDEPEQQHLFATLSEAGGVLMPLGDYGFSRRFGWVADRYGVSWQLNLPA
jgi:predicted 3-demethylubiquinone-9 3-methyltransferase (glyoxalase superfamily)